MKKKWGYYKVLLKGKGFWVKRLAFEDGKSTSLQTHKNRDEIWVIFVPRGTKHKVGGSGDVFELALGEPKESDIRRYRDEH